MTELAQNFRSKELLITIFAIYSRRHLSKAASIWRPFPVGLVTKTHGALAMRAYGHLRDEHSQAMAARSDRIVGGGGRIRLELSRRSVISRIEVETEVSRIAGVVGGRLLRMLNDAPSQLLGLSEADIHRVLEEKLTFAMRDLKLSDDFWNRRTALEYDNGNGK